MVGFFLKIVLLDSQITQTRVRSSRQRQGCSLCGDRGVSWFKLYGGSRVSFQNQGLEAVWPKKSAPACEIIEGINIRQI